MASTGPRCGAVDPLGRVCALPPGHAGAHATAEEAPPARRQSFGPLVLVAVIGVALGAFALSRQPGAEPAAGAPDARVSLTVSGEGMMSTGRMTLAGDYVVSWTAIDTGSARVGCYHGASLVPASGRGRESLVSASLEGGETKTGTQYLYGLEAGDYYVEANSGCGWTFTFTPG